MAPMRVYVRGKDLGCPSAAGKVAMLKFLLLVFVVVFVVGAVVTVVRRVKQS